MPRIICLLAACLGLPACDPSDVLGASAFASWRDTDPPDTAPLNDFGALFYQESQQWACDKGETIAAPFDFRRADGATAYVMPPQVVVCYDLQKAPDGEDTADTAEERERLCYGSHDYSIGYPMPIQYDHGTIYFRCTESGTVFIYQAAVPASCSG